MKPKKIIDEKINPEKVTVFGLPLRITPEIRDVTFRLSKTNPEKYAAIKKSIGAANGKLDEPIKIFKLGSETGDYFTIVDGHTRFEILMELGSMPPDSDFVDISKDVMCVDDAKALAYRLNDLRRQEKEFQEAVNALKIHLKEADVREVALNSGVGKDTISRTRYILSVSEDTTNKTTVEMAILTQIFNDLASGEKGVRPVYEQFKIAEEVSNTIILINDNDFQKSMFTEFEAKKYTDKAAVKHLQAKIDEHTAIAQGLDLANTPYNKAIFPVMQKIIKLQDVYSGVNSITTAGHKEAVDNALNSVRTYLMNNINENIVDVLEGVRAVLITELEQKQSKDVAAIMKQLPEILQISKDHGYFIATMVLPKDPKGTGNVKQ